MVGGRHRRGNDRLPVVVLVAVAVVSIVAVGSLAGSSVSRPGEAPPEEPVPSSVPPAGASPYGEPVLPGEPLPAAEPLPADAGYVPLPSGGGWAPAWPDVLPVRHLTSATAANAVAAAIRAAMDQIGLPYTWGGDGPAAGEIGFDCSGLTRFAYAQAGIELPRTAHRQFYAGPLVPPGTPLQAGDLVFYGTLDRVHHVGLYLGGSRMVNAPTFGKPVQVAYYRWRGDDYLGATRPAARFGDPGVLPPLSPRPDPPPDRGPTVFEAPPAPIPDGVPDVAAPQPPEPETAAAAISAAPAVPAVSAVPSAGTPGNIGGSRAPPGLGSAVRAASRI
nr:NlpC/P60 family protein [Pseudonocardia sp. TRM90224]